ncbi:MAG: carbohydrate ABC transporter permease [Eubacteriales bacterium]|nr:carbohydrate ABC transporter permease [Eubacteriales bacterium]
MIQAIRKSPKRALAISVITVFLVIMTFSFLYPLYYILLNALKPKMDYIVDPFGLPSNATLDNFKTLFADYNIWLHVGNSLFIAVVSTALVLITSSIASYAIAKLQFRGKTIAYMIILATMFLPGQVTMIPKYTMFAQMGLIDSHWAIILSSWAAGVPGAVLLLRSSFIGISNEMIESAKIDGAGFFTILFRIVMPVSVAGIAVVLIFQFIGTWNDFLTPLLYLTSQSKQTLMVILSQMVTRYGKNPTIQLAGIFVSLIPSVTLYLCLQKYMIKGVMKGSLK